MIAESLAHYRIIKKLGRGGMGEVYLAQDTKLDRKVAIKVLAPEMVARENAKKRLVREAQAAAKLDHPNICAIYDVDEADGHTFIVMQYVKGETLSAIMRRKVLRLAVTIDIAQQTAEGLAEAHAQGVIHRDIKPQNIIITPRGQVKILDFGLSKQLHKGDDIDNEAPTVSLLSTPGKVIGTMPYMSPEQVRGEALDESSDIFSLGVMFHEMVAGKHPFKAQSSQVTMSRILLAEPYTSDRLQTLAPADLQRVISKMLAKDKSERYESAEAFLSDLKQLPSSTPSDETQSLAAATKEHSITTPPPEKVASPILAKVMAYKWAALAVLLAVVVTAVVTNRLLSANRLDSLAILPFTYASNDPQLMANPDREYLSDGFTDSVINNLSQLPDLKIIARSSVFRYKGKDLDIQTVGRQLNVRAVLVGQIKQEGDELTITTELMDVKDNRSLGVDTYKRKVADIHTVQEEIARNIAEKLRWKLTGADKTHLAKTYTTSGEAYEAYLKGRYHWNKRTEEGFQQAAKFFKEATDKDPNYALAYSGLADCYTLESDYGFLAPTEGYRLAEGYTTLALKFDDTLAEAHTSLASIKAVKDWDWLGAENEYRRAIELNPNYPTAHHWYAAHLLLEGKLDEALVEITKAQQLDPLSLGINKDFAIIYLYRKDYERALNQARKTLDIESNFHVMSTYIAQVYEFQQKYPDAVAELEKAHSAAPDDNEINYALGQAYALSGRKDEALKISNQLTQPGKPGPLPKEAAYLYDLLGQRDKAIAMLQAAADDHYISAAELKMDPRLAALRTDARAIELLHKIGLQ
jgi:serine/threonine-protein kinase